MDAGFDHIVLFRLRAGVTLERVRAAKEALASLVETLPGVRRFAVTHNLAAAGHGYSLALISTFEDRRAYEIFDRHPEARRVLDQFMHEVVEAHIVVQAAPDD